MVAFIIKLLLFYLLFLMATTALRFWRTYKLLKSQKPFSKRENPKNEKRTTGRPGDIEAEYRVISKKNDSA